MKKTDTLKKNKDGSFVLTVKITLPQLKKQKEKNLKIFASTLKLEGFRKGQVPLEIAQGKIDESQLTNQSLQDILNQLYPSLLEKYFLKPIFSPRVNILPPQDRKDQTMLVKISSCERPTLLLKPYQAKIKALNAQQKTKNKKQNQEKQTKKIIDALLALSQITLSPFLIEEETDRKLSQIINYTQQANLSLEDYFKSQKTTLETFKSEFEKQLKKEWAATLALEKIADDLKITVSSEEIQDAIPPGAKDPPHPYFLTQILRQRKTIKKLSQI